MILQIGLPVTSRPPFDPERLFSTFAQSFRETVSRSNEVRIYLGIDDNDAHYCRNYEAVISRLASITGAKLSPIFMDAKRYAHRICAIWDTLARLGYGDGCDSFLFAGDDLRFITQGWDEKLCDPIMRRGYGIEAFYDIAFPDFPTFPIFHRSHIDCFGSVFPESFCDANQQGDPFLYELYRSIGAANLHRDVRCENTIGGTGPARYNKVNPADVPLAEWGCKLWEWLNRRQSETVAPAPARSGLYCGSNPIFDRT